MAASPTERSIFIPPHRLGDCLFWTPALRHLRQHRPGIEVDVLATSPEAQAVFGRNPWVRLVREPGREYARAVCGVLNRRVVPLMEGLDCPVLALGGERRTRTAARPEGPIRVQAAVMWVERVRRAFHVQAPCTDYSYEVVLSSADRQEAEEVLRGIGVTRSAGPLIGLAVGCRSAAKQRAWWRRRRRHAKSWSVEHAIAAIDAIAGRFPEARWLLTGVGAERTLCQHIEDRTTASVNLVDRLSIGALAALLDRLTCFVTTDSGPLQLAYARKTAVIALFHGTEPAATGPPPGQRNQVVLMPVDGGEIRAEQVTEAVGSWLR